MGIGEALLLVDDDELWLRACERALRGAYRVVLARDHSEAIEFARVEPVRMALVDLFMPGYSGVHVIRELVSIQPGVFAVLVSTANRIDATVEAMRAGARNSFPKPTGRAELLDLVARLEVERAQARDNASSVTLQEWAHVQKVVESCDGNISRAAKILGVDRSTVARIYESTRPRR